MQSATRDQICGTVVAIVTDDEMSYVTVAVGGSVSIRSPIYPAKVSELALLVGDTVKMAASFESFMFSR